MLDLQAVIGAGAAGLVTARELQREGHSVQVSLRPSEVLSMCLPYCEGHCLKYAAHGAGI